MSAGLNTNFDIPFRCVPAVQNTIDRIDRTEDVCFSPDGTLLAIASYYINKIFIFKLELQQDHGKLQILLTDYLEINSSNFDHPHGIGWFDNQTIIVANRKANPAVIPLPTIWPNDRVCNLRPIQTLKFGKLAVPDVQKVGANSNLCVSKLDQNLFAVYVCSNNGNVVTHHILNANNNFQVENSKILLKKDLKVPDGVRVSDNGNWIAVSNHLCDCVHVYSTQSDLTVESAALALLKGTLFPHGLGFYDDDRIIVVSDSGAPFVHFYYSPTGDWNGEFLPVYTMQVISNEDFTELHVKKSDGGPKGISIFSNILAVTSQKIILKFVDLDKICENL